MTTFEKVQEMLSEQLKIDKSKIKPESDIILDLKADSLAIFYMIMGLEEEYKITIDDEKAASLKKVEDVVKYIDSLKK